MARDDYYASLFGRAFSTYMERPRLSRAIGRALWGGDVKRYYESADLFCSYWGLHCFHEPAAALSEAEIESWLAAAGFGPSDTERSGPMLFFDARKGRSPAAAEGVGFEPTRRRKDA